MGWRVSIFFHQYNDTKNVFKKKLLRLPARIPGTNHQSCHELTENPISKYSSFTCTAKNGREKKVEVSAWEYIQTKSKVLFKIYSRSSLLFSYFFSISNEGLTSKVKLPLLMRHCQSFVSLGHSELCIYCNLQHLIEKGQSGLRSISTWQREEKWKQFICTNLNNSSQSPFLYLCLDNSCILAHSQSSQTCQQAAFYEGRNGADRFYESRCQKKAIRSPLPLTHNREQELPLVSS